MRRHKQMGVLSTKEPINTVHGDGFPPTRAVRIYLLLRETHQLASKVFEAGFRNLGLSTSQYAVLRYLQPDDEIPLSELSRRLTQGKSNLTTLIPRMEKRGLVETVPNTHDKRSTLIRLTEAGRRLREQAVPAHRQVLQAMLQELTPDEQEQLLDLLHRTREGLLAVTNVK